MSAIAVIPARGGSRRIPRKNIRQFHGKPIIAYSIEAARDSKLFSRIVVSTEDDEIAAVAKKYGAEVLIRPEPLAQDEVGTQEVMAHAMMEFLEYKKACCIYPTAPMVTRLDLVRGHFQLNPFEGTVYAMSVNQAPLYAAGQWYWGYTAAFTNKVPLIGHHTAMIPIDKDRVCDINTEEDWVRAEMMFTAWQKRRQTSSTGRCLSPSGVCDQATCFDMCAWAPQP